MLSRALRNLTFWVAAFGLLGYAAGHFLGSSSWPTSPNPPAIYEAILFFKSTFLSLLRMLVAPIVFFSLVGGLLAIGDVRRLRTMGAVAITYYVSTTALAILLGLGVVFFIHPWESMAPDTLAAVHGAAQAPAAVVPENAGSLFVVLKSLASQAFVNPFAALANTNILGLVANAFLFGLALLWVLPKDSPLVRAVGDINRVLHTLLGWVIWVTPLGVFAIIFDFSLKLGGGLFAELFGFAAVVFGATMVHGFVVLPILAYLFAGRTPRAFLGKILKPMLVAFSTSSSSATLPVTMQTAETELGVSPAVSSFVFPLGATMNMDGTALFEGVAAVFLAFLFGKHLSSTAMVAIFLMAMVSSIGAPGMPSGSMAGMQMVLLAAGIPLEAIGILLIIERPLDTFRTAVNVEGDIIGAMVVERYMAKRTLPGASAVAVEQDGHRAAGT